VTKAAGTPVFTFRKPPLSRQEFRGLGTGELGGDLFDRTAKRRAGLPGCGLMKAFLADGHVAYLERAGEGKKKGAAEILSAPGGRWQSVGKGNVRIAYASGTIESAVGRVAVHSFADTIHSIEVSIREMDGTRDLRHLKRFAAWMVRLSSSVFAGRWPAFEGLRSEGFRRPILGRPWSSTATKHRFGAATRSAD